MPRQPDLVADSCLDTTFRDSSTIHTYREIDEAGNRFSRRETWEQVGVLGNGGFGTVSLQKCASGGAEQLRVVKMIRKPSRSADYTRELEAVAKFSKRRYRLWFVRSFGWYEDSDSFFITMEYCRLGDLQGYLDKHRRLRQGEVQILSCQIVEGLAQMHMHGFAHRDLKPANILIKSKAPEQKWWVVLADFGITKKVDNSTELATKLVGTLAFMAPELRGYMDQDRPDQPNSGLHSSLDFKAADMWAFGEIMFRMLTGEPTFRTALELVRYCEGREEFPTQRLPRSLDEHGVEIIASIMRVSPQSRMSSAGCTKHHWLQMPVETDFNMLSIHPTPATQAGSSSQLSAPNASARWSRLSIRDHHRQTEDLKPSNTIPDGVELPSCNNDTSTQDTIKDVLSPTLRAEMKPLLALNHSRRIVMASFSPDGKRLACLTDDSTIHVWDTRSWIPLYVSEPHGSPKHHNLELWSFQRIRFSLDGKRLISKNIHYLYRGVWHWDAESGEILQSINSYSFGSYHVDDFEKSYCLDVSLDGKYAAMCSRENSEFWLKNLISDTLWQLSGHTSPIEHIEFSPAGLQLFSFSKDREVRFWDVQTGKLNCVLKGHLDDYGLPRPIFSSDGTRLIKYYSCEEWQRGSTRKVRRRYLQIWKAGSEQLLSTTHDWDSLPRLFALSPDNGQIAHLPEADHQAIQLWDLKMGKTLWTFKTPSIKQIGNASFSPDGKLLALALSRRPHARFTVEVALLDSKTGRLVQRLGTSSVLSWLQNFNRPMTRRSHRNEPPVFSADGNYLVAALESNELQVWTRDEDALARVDKV